MLYLSADEACKYAYSRISIANMVGKHAFKEHPGAILPAAFVFPDKEIVKDEMEEKTAGLSFR